LLPGGSAGPEQHGPSRVFPASPGHCRGPAEVGGPKPKPKPAHAHAYVLQRHPVTPATWLICCTFSYYRQTSLGCCSPRHPLSASCHQPCRVCSQKLSHPHIVQTFDFAVTKLKVGGWVDGYPGYYAKCMADPPYHIMAIATRNISWLHGAAISSSASRMLLPAVLCLLSSPTSKRRMPGVTGHASGRHHTRTSTKCGSCRR